MKVIFLDFDGVLNSVQESVGKNNRRERSWYWNKRERFANWLCGLGWKKVDIGDGRMGYSSDSRRKDPLKIFRTLSDFGRDHVADHGEFSEASCALIQFLLGKDKDLRIVVSSTWRLAGLKRMKQVLKRNLIDPDKVIDVTPGTHEDSSGRVLEANVAGDNVKNFDGSRRMGRGTQIQAWLNHNKNLNVTHFAIIDDDSDMIHLMHRFVKTDGYVGFTWRNMEKVADLLDINLNGDVKR